MAELEVETVAFRGLITRALARCGLIGVWLSEGREGCGIRSSL